VKPAHLDRHKLGDVVINGDAPNHYRLGPLNSDSETSDGSDRAVLNDGWISLTPLMMDVTAHLMLERLPILDIAAAKQAYYDR
jgi:broad specificity polyphosphatase/5'/3'-nucleotidase SurE